MLRGTGGSRPATPPASPIPGDELWLRAGSKHHQELPQQAPNSSIHSYILGRCFLKQLGSHQLWPWEGEGNTAQDCSTKGITTSPWSLAEPSNCLQTMGLEETKYTPSSQLIQTIPQKLCKPSFREGLIRAPGLLTAAGSLQPRAMQHRGCLLLFLIYCDPHSNSVKCSKWSL